MVKLRILSLILVLAILVIPVLPGVADSTTYNHIIPITVTDTSGVARTNVPVIISYDVDSQIVLGLLNSTATDADMQVSSSAIDFMLASSNITAVIPSLPAYGSITMSLYTGYDPAVSNYPIITGAGGYVTVDDDATIELGGDGAVSLTDVYIQDGETLVNKDEAISIVGDSGNVTATIYESSTTTDNLTPDGAGDYTGIASVSGAATHWQAVDDAPASPDDATTYVYTSNTTQELDSYTITNTIPSNAQIQSVYVYFRTWANDANGKAQPYLLLGSDNTTGTEISVANQTWTTYSENLTRPGGGSWLGSDFDDLQVGIGIRDTVTGPIRVTQVYVSVTYYDAAASVSQAVTAGEHDYLAQKNTPFFSQGIDVSGNITPVAENLVLNAPLWQTESSVSPFTTIDSTGYTITTYGAATWTTDGYSFDGVTGTYLTIGAFAPSGAFAAAAWVKGVSFTQYDGIAGQYGTANTGFLFDLAGVSGSSASPRFVIDPGGANEKAVSFGTNSITAGSWYYLTATGDGSTLRTYLNGVSTGIIASYTAPLAASASQAYIGRGYGPATIWDGLIGEFMWHAAVLTPSQILQNFNVTKGHYGYDSGITTYSTLATVPDNANDWTLLDGVPYAGRVQIDVAGVNVLDFYPSEYIQSDTLTDESGNGNDGTITWGTNSNMTVAQGPQVTSHSATSVGATSVLMQGELDDIGDYANVYVSFEYGLTNAYGYFTSETSVATPQLFSVTLTGLTPSTTYHYRAVARYGSVYAYGEDISFTTLVSPSSGGSTTPLITIAGVFGGYITTGDLLIAAEITNTYPPYYPTADPSQYFQIQLVDTDGTTILGASPLTMWGDRPASIYLNPTVAATLTEGSAYIIRVKSISSAITVSEDYTLTGLDWKGNNLKNLDQWCISAATNMQLTDGTSLTNPYIDSITDYNIVITDAAGGYFTKGIPGIAQIRPDLFTAGQTSTTPVTGSGTILYNDGSTLADRIGAQLPADATTVGAVFGISGASFLNYLAIGGIILIILGVVSETKGWGALGALCLCAPLLGTTTYLNIVGIALIGIMMVIFAFLFVRQFVWKTL